MPMSRFSELIQEELPKDWEDLPYEEKYESRVAATARASERWRIEHSLGALGRRGVVSAS